MECRISFRSFDLLSLIAFFSFFFLFSFPFFPEKWNLPIIVGLRFLFQRTSLFSPMYADLNLNQRTSFDLEPSMIVPRGRLPLVDSASMQIRHEISLIVVCRMAELGNRPFCGSDRDRPKTATRPRSESIRRRLRRTKRGKERRKLLPSSLLETPPFAW